MNDRERFPDGGGASDDDQVREQLQSKLRRGQLPRALPAGLRIPGGIDRERITVGGGRGFACSVCGSVIGFVDLSPVELRYQSGLVLRFHTRCSELWMQERHRPHPSV